MGLILISKNKSDLFGCNVSLEYSTGVYFTLVFADLAILELVFLVESLFVLSRTRTVLVPSEE